MNYSNKQYCFILLFLVFASCRAQNKPVAIKNKVTGGTSSSKKEISSSVSGVDTIAGIENIRSIFQDKNGRYWFGTNGAGVFSYDGKTLLRFSEKDGLSDNQVLSIQEDRSGNIWFGTGMFGVSRFDGKSFTTFTTKEKIQAPGGSGRAWESGPDDLWFYAGGGSYRYNGSSFTYLQFPGPGFNTDDAQRPANRLSRYAVYATLKDTKGNLWFGTQAMGVGRYDGKSFTWFTEKGLAGLAVLAIFEDQRGNLWFGNNGHGLFRYDGKLLSCITEEKGLDNKDFLVSGKAGPGTLARIYSINEDRNGALWIGTVDAGVWRYEENNLTNYTIKDGLGSNAVNTIYKDKKGDLWFGTDAAGIFTFNGLSFSKSGFK